MGWVPLWFRNELKSPTRISFESLPVFFTADYFVYEKKMLVEYSESHVGQLCNMIWKDTWICYNIQWSPNVRKHWTFLSKKSILRLNVKNNDVMWTTSEHLMLDIMNHQVLFMPTLLLLSLKHKRDNIARHLEMHVHFSFSRMKPFHQRFQTF